MASKKKEAEQKNRSTESSPKKKSPLIKILVLVVGLGVLGGAGFFAYTKFFAKGDAPEVAHAKPALMKPVVKDMETFLVNLADPGGERYLKVTMQLSLNNEAVSREIDTRIGELRDTILMLLSSKEYDDISSLSGKLALKRTLINNLNRILQQGTVQDIYFTEFLVQ
ncbi:flagellar basal body-associated FliL family protein [Desulfosoma caldarium]|uniref:Flagellar protein FliL n=1 Tax=Desulfosoma caldarium TaxID=610254 RepID=A0A3N1VIY4_9BACT|nr:flagellar basal body-associated protein FliL [Desulfosoma caldarium]ROR01880.1 flagellar FliL protein [Desulfosoma caldarium]